MHLVTDDTLLETQFPEESDITNCSESSFLFVPGFTRNTMTSQCLPCGGVRGIQWQTQNQIWRMKSQSQNY